ncbi:uncharacterized protein LOC131162506 [Malania oleifera]|uniref:uncharacterized protein LOC131162506 n=1 Tax=Malania oleifera TaxID=397392 RepID=UPI0025ADDBBC|nr:uncharacterized protein LOC131162506 [Malania oleifera]
MLNPFLCGAFHPEDQEENEQWSPRKSSRRSSSFCRRSSRDASKNPYSRRGLDKFSALLADLEEKRQKIYAQIGSDEISFVRFAYPVPDSNDCVPIVVKLRDRKKQEPAPEKPPPTNSPAGEIESADRRPEDPEPEQKVISDGIKRGGFESWSEMVRMDKWRRPSYYMVAAVILILVVMAAFGRSVAILCTSFGWYLVPTLSGESSGKAVKKKVYGRRMSEKKRVVRVVSHVGGVELDSPRGGNKRAGTRDNSPEHAHRRRRQ